MSPYTKTATRRNALDGRTDLPHHRDHLLVADLTPGAREVFKRTRWSASLCNAVASAWSYGSVEA